MNQIAVPVTGTQSKGIAFIAMPFDDDQFGAVEQTIINAAILAGFFPRITKRTSDPDWLDEIRKSILDARVIIAVLTPEKNSMAPCSNVLYELGLAHGLDKDKETVIVIDDRQNLPSDIRTKKVLSYSSDKLRELEKELAVRLLDRTWDTVSAVTKLPVRLDPFLSACLQILHFVKSLHHGYQLLNELDDLLRVLEVTAKSSADENVKNVKICKRACDAYTAKYKLLSEDFLEPCQRQRDEMDKAFKGLSDCSGPELFAKMEKYYALLKHKALDLYPRSHDKMCETAPFYNAVVSSKQRSDFSAQLEHLSTTAKAIIGDADNLILHLIDEMTSHGRSNG